MSNLLHVGLTLIISKVFTILCLLCLCRNREHPGNFQNEIAISKLFFQMSAQLKWEGRSFWSGQGAQIYPLNYLLLTYRSNVNYYKSFHHPIRTLPVGTGSIQLSFQIYYFLAQREGERKAFFGKVQEGWPHWKIITWLI